MSIDVRWYSNAQNIIYYEFNPGWNWQLVIEAFDAGDELAKSVDHQVDCIMDFSKTGVMVPKGAFAFAKYAMSNKPVANMNMTVIVGTRFIKTLVDAITKLSVKESNWPIHFVSSVDEALDYLKASEPARY